MGMVLITIGCLVALTIAVTAYLLKLEWREIGILVGALLIVGAMLGTSPLLDGMGRKFWLWIGVSESLYEEKK